MGGDSGESTDGYSGEGTSGETSSESSSSNEVSSGEVSDAFGESNEDNVADVNPGGTEAVSERGENPENNGSGEIEHAVSETEITAAFGEKTESGKTSNENDDKIETENNDSEEAEEISETEISDLPPNVQDSYQNYETEGWTGPHEDAAPGTKGGGEFANRDGDLPTADDKGNPISYREFDVNDKPADGSGRDGERFVVGSDGSVYYTADHYDSFTKIK